VTFFPTTNTLILVGIFNPIGKEALDASSKLFTQYLNGEDSLVEARAAPNAFSNKVLNAGFSNFVLPTRIPGFASKLISTIEFNTINLDVKPDTVLMSVDAIIGIDSPLGSNGKLETNSLTLDAVVYDANRDRVGQLSVKETFPTFRNNSVIHITFSGELDLDPSKRKRSFSDLMSDFIQDNRTSIGISGKSNADVTLAIGRMTINNIKLDNTVGVDGMGNLSSIQVLSFDLTSSTSEQIIANMVVNIDNPSDTTASLGDIYFNIFYSEALLGKATAQSVSLSPGSNSISMSAIISPSQQDISITQTLFSQYLTGLPSVIQAKASSPASNIPAVSQGLSGLVLTTTLEGSTDQLIDVITFNSMYLKPIDDNTAVLRAVAVVQIISPLGPNGKLIAKQMSLSVELGDGKVVFGKITSPATVISSTNSLIQVEIDGTVEITNAVEFGNFINGFVQNPTAGLRIQGTADATVETSIGLIQVNGIKVDETVTLEGLEGLKQVNLVSFDLKSSTLTQILMNLVVSIDNPSFATLLIPDLTFDIYYQNTKMGYSTGYNVLIKPGMNNIQLSGEINPENQTVANGLFDSYINGLDSQVSALASSNCSSNTLVRIGM